VGSKNQKPSLEAKLKTDKPLVSIVTPSFNQGLYLDETIQSVLNQDYPNIEYIIIDGGSTDGSLEIIKRYEERIDYWVSEPDLGQTDAINKGFAHAKGEILAWLNSDDTYRPEAIQEAVDYLVAHPDAGMVYGHAFYVDEEGKVVAHFPTAETGYYKLRRGNATIPQQAAFFRSTLWKMVGPLDPSFYYAMDYDLWIRISSVSTIDYYPRLWANFRLQNSSKSMQEAHRCWPEIIRIHFRDGGSVFSILYAKYLLRRILEPIMPLRMKLWKWKFAIEKEESRLPSR
jgi:glycosyltransferase involved in cell wall biosynthesis